MIRWPLHLVGLALSMGALWLCLRCYLHQKRGYLAFMVVYLAHEVVFYGVLVGRVILYQFTDPPLTTGINFWANVVMIHGLLALCCTFYLACRRGNV